MFLAFAFQISCSRLADEKRAEERSFPVEKEAEPEGDLSDSDFEPSEEEQRPIGVDPIFINPGSDKCKRNGLTWALASHDCGLGLDNVSCASCNPYSGDTICASSLPILCIYKAKMPRPGYAIGCTAHAMPKEFYCGWSGAYIKATKPVVGCKIDSKATADKICQSQFGSCWEMASHGDGYYIQGMDQNNYAYCSWDWGKATSGGWAFFAYGNVGASTKGRFWTYIADQPGNCWN